MNLYRSALLSIDYREKNRLLLPRWSGALLNAESFVGEMKTFMSFLEKTRAGKVVWDHTDFRFHIPDSLYPWIETTVNQPGKELGCRKVGFILGEDVMAQFSTMDSFEATQSVFAPRYFSDPEKAIGWANMKEAASANPFEKEIRMLVQKNAGKGTALIQIEVSLEQLPYYMKELKDLCNHQAFVHRNYQKYMLLTAREKEILGLVLQGNSNKAVADRLFTSVHTVTTHRRNILRKLECKSMADLIRYKLFL